MTLFAAPPTMGSSRRGCILPAMYRRATVTRGTPTPVNRTRPTMEYPGEKMPTTISRRGTTPKAVIIMLPMIPTLDT